MLQYIATAWNNSDSYWLTPWCRVILHKLLVSQLVMQFPLLYRNQNPLDFFINNRNLSLSWAILIHSMTSHMISLLSILILSFYLRLGLPRCLVPSRFANQNPIYTPLLHAKCSNHLSFLHVIVLILVDRNTNNEASQCIIFSSPLRQDSY